MSLSMGLGLLCAVLLVTAAVFAWMTLTRLRDRRNAVEFIQLDTAVCIRRDNGDIDLRQQRGKSILGLFAGVLMAVGGGAGLVYSFFHLDSIGMEILCTGLGLLPLGVVLVWVSSRSFGEGSLRVNLAEKTLEIQPGLLRPKQRWVFSAVKGITRESHSREAIFLSLVEGLVTDQNSSPMQMKVVIGIQHMDGFVIHLCTAAGEAADQVPDLLAGALGKPVIKRT